MPTTVYWIGVRAHNELGASEQATTFVKTRPAGPGDKGDVWVEEEVDEIIYAEFPLVLVVVVIFVVVVFVVVTVPVVVVKHFPKVPVLVAGVTAAGLILLCLIDIGCCCLWDRGVAHMLCGKRCCAKPRQTKPEQNGTTKPPQDVFNLSTGGDGRLATVRGGRRTLEGRQQRGQEGLYDAPEWGYNAQESLLPGNLENNDDDVMVLASRQPLRGDTRPFHIEERPGQVSVQG